MTFENTSERIARYTSQLSAELHDLRAQLYPPEARKQFGRTFTTQDLAKLLNIPKSTLRTLSLDGKGPVPERSKNGSRIYTLQQVGELREFLASQRPDEELALLPHRRGAEQLQILAAANFKGGSSKTTTSVHLAHYLALQGYRVLCIDLDPQASMTSTFGLQPEFDVGDDETAYAALRYDTNRRPLKEVIRETYFPGLDLIPANLELMDFEFDTPSALNKGVRDELGLFFARLRSAISTVEDDYDMVVIDTPPSLGYSTLAALYAATGMIVTVHPAMLDVASCNQFLIMISQLSDVLEEFGAKFQHSFFRILLTRVNPNDGPQKFMSSVMRKLFAEDMMVAEALESTAVAAAGVAKKSLYELENGEVGRDPLLRALDSVDRVNAEILGLIHEQWGRAS
ncbi:plasmid partitioning protein RepA [Roseibium marinum]|uniref:Chromosome partitioning protein n=1 Tax=Roseibium marinum TaxID=281252 RepID=A0A2S3UJA1_9HYPH|nr:plasmid partitioning protein RepA [Roseibium marinum]POF27721.1 chromosome partitioning protein [Roseibium marinum]